MSRRRRTQRPPRNWVSRILAAGAVAVLGGFAISHAMAYRLRTASPTAAVQLAPYDGRLTAMAAAVLAGADASPSDRRSANELAIRALRQDPTAVAAASTLGLNAQLSGDVANARRFFRYAEALSRRDMQTQLWAIEDSVGRSDIANALKHYDIALRVTPSLSEMLFPVLSSASTDPEIRVALVKTFVAKPAWADSFIPYLAGNTPDPRATARLLHDLEQAGVTVSGTTQSTLVNSLLASGFVDDAWAFYASVRPKADRRFSRDPRFSATSEMGSQFDWITFAPSGASVSILREGKAGVLDFSLPAMVGATLLQQQQVLPPGDYQLRGHSNAIEQPARTQPYWQLSCKTGRELGRIPIQNSSLQNGNFSGRFSVPADCGVQVLSLVAQPSESVSGVSGQIDFIELRPAQ